MTEAVCENSIAASVTFTAEIKSFSAGFFRLKRKAFQRDYTKGFILSLARLIFEHLYRY